MGPLGTVLNGPTCPWMEQLMNRRFIMSEDINFEDAMKKLEEIADELEKGDLTLDESVKKFEDGINLSKKCKNAW